MQLSRASVELVLVTVSELSSSLQTPLTVMSMVDRAMRVLWEGGLPSLVSVKGQIRRQVVVIDLQMSVTDAAMCIVAAVTVALDHSV